MIVLRVIDKRKRSFNREMTKQSKNIYARLQHIESWKLNENYQPRLKNPNFEFVKLHLR